MGCFIERKTPGDLAGCIGHERQRFVRENAPWPHGDCLVVVIEGTLAADIPSTALSARSLPGRWVTARLSLPGANAWQRISPFAFLPASFLPVSAGGLSKPGERSRKR